MQEAQAKRSNDRFPATILHRLSGSCSKAMMRITWYKSRTFYGIISNQTNIEVVRDDQLVLQRPHHDTNHSQCSRLSRNRTIAKGIVEGKNEMILNQVSPTDQRQLLH